MSFSWDIKKKLCDIKYDNCPFCVRGELAGIIGFSGDFSDEHLKLMTEHKLLAERITQNIEECIGYSAKVTGEKNKKILIDNKTVLDNLRAYIYLSDDQTENEFDEEMLKLDCCKASYVRGAFLGGGCVLDPESAYHLEFDTKYKKSSMRLYRLLESMGYPVKHTYRKGHYLVYLKGYEAIAEVLGLMGDGMAALAMHYAQMEKDMRNNINRYVNCETANAKKIAAASARQMSAIKKIQSKQGVQSLPENLRELAYLRLEYPEAGLQTLGEMLNPPIGKSGVNHRMNRLIEIAEDIK